MYLRTFSFASLFVAFTGFGAWSQPQYVTTIQPLAAVLSQITAGQAEITRLLPRGASPHTYEPRPSDLKTAHNALALFYVSDDLDGWAKRLKQEPAFEVFGFVPITMHLESIADCLENHDHGHHLGEIDSHFWLDPLAVKAVLPQLVNSLNQAEGKVNPVYEKQAKQLSVEFDQLHQWVEKTLKPVKGKSVVFTHGGFQYYLNRYGLKIAGLIEPSPGKTPSPRRIKELIDLVRKHNVKAIFSEPQLANSPAKVLAEAAGIQVAEVDPLGGVDGRLTYQEIIRYNTETILEALK